MCKQRCTSNLQNYRKVFKKICCGENLMNKVKDIIRRLEQEKDPIKKIVIADELLTEVTKVRNELARSYR